MPRQRILPPDRVIDQLYWFEGLICSEIAARYGVTKGAVVGVMRRAGIPRRAACRKRGDGCLSDGCQEPVVRIKRRDGVKRWCLTTRCYYHYILHKRTRDRMAAARYHGWTGRGPSSKKVLMQSADVHPDDWPTTELAPIIDSRFKDGRRGPRGPYRKKEKSVVEGKNASFDNSQSHRPDGNVDRPLPLLSLLLDEVKR